MGFGVVAILVGLGGFFVATHDGRPSLVSLATASPTARAKASPLATPVVAVPVNSQSTQPAAPPGTPIAQISIPRIGIRNAPIFDRGVDSKGVMAIAPGYAVKHYSYSAPFGTGNAVIYGHDDIQGNVFGHLYDLAAGDVVQITVNGATQTYRVAGHQIVAPTAVSVLAPTSDARLTIITCWPFNVDTKRWIVTAVKS